MPNLYTLEKCSVRIANEQNAAAAYAGSIQFSDGEGDNWGGSFHSDRGRIPFVAGQQYAVWHNDTHRFDIQMLGASDDSGAAVFAGIGPRPLEEDYA
jgi:hypothetical protein